MCTYSVLKIIISNSGSDVLGSEQVSIKSTVTKNRTPGFQDKNNNLLDELRMNETSISKEKENEKENERKRKIDNVDKKTEENSKFPKQLNKDENKDENKNENENKFNKPEVEIEIFEDGNYSDDDDDKDENNDNYIPNNNNNSDDNNNKNLNNNHNYLWNNKIDSHKITLMNNNIHNIISDNYSDITFEPIPNDNETKLDCENEFNFENQNISNILETIIHNNFELNVSNNKNILSTNSDLFFESNNIDSSSNIIKTGKRIGDDFQARIEDIIPFSIFPTSTSSSSTSSSPSHIIKNQVR